ncbi:MAG TPA: ubiquitin-like protein, partial [Microbacteriaceae bacterium]|nr:ubiquitin-like protein [Microbacteriaceae bacterium]
MKRAFAATIALVLGGFFALGSATAASAVPAQVTIVGARTLTVDTNDSDSVQQVKQKIEDQTSVPVGDQTLLFAGTVLEDGRTLGDYAIQNGSTLTLLLMPAWTDNVLATPALNTQYDDSVAAGGGEISYAIVAGALPPGLTIDTESGTVSGAATASGGYAFTVSASNLVGSVEQEFSGEIAAATVTPTAGPTQAPATVPADNQQSDQQSDELAETGMSTP